MLGGGSQKLVGMPRAQRLRLIGGGGHAAVVVESARGAGWIVKGFYDDDPSASPDGFIPHLGGLGRAGEGGHETSLIIAIGDLAKRGQIIEALGAVRALLGIVVDRSASVSVTALLGGGVFVGPQAAVNARATVGAHAIVNTGAVVEHDCAIGENVHIGPRAVLGGRVEVGEHTLIGIGATVKPGVRIGAGCTVAAGAVVVGDVAAGATVRGVPAR